MKTLYSITFLPGNSGKGKGKGKGKRKEKDMAHIKITKGLDIPLTGRPQGTVQALIPSGQAASLNPPPHLALNLRAFDQIKFRLLVKVGDVVTIGQPLAEDKDTPGRMFVSPAAGVVKEVRRGLKRSLQDIIIEVDQQKEDFHQFLPIDPQTASTETLSARLLEGGCFSAIHCRPFNMLANPKKTPRCIFVKALESAPCVPPAELQVADLASGRYEKEFQTGLDALAKLTSGPVHLVYHKNTSCKAFLNASGVQKHTAEDPIRSPIIPYTSKTSHRSVLPMMSSGRSRQGMLWASAIS